MLKDLDIITKNIVKQPLPTWLVVLIFIISVALLGLSYFMFKRHENGNEVDMGSWVCVLLVSAIVCVSSLYSLIIPQKTVYEYVVRIDNKSNNLIHLHISYDVVSSNDNIYVIRTTENVEKQ